MGENESKKGKKLRRTGQIIKQLRAKNEREREKKHEEKK